MPLGPGIPFFPTDPGEPMSPRWPLEPGKPEKTVCVTLLKCTMNEDTFVSFPLLKKEKNPSVRELIKKKMMCLVSFPPPLPLLEKILFFLICFKNKLNSVTIHHGSSEMGVPALINSLI